MPYITTLASVGLCLAPLSGLYRIVFVFASTETRSAGRFLHTSFAAGMWLFGFLTYGYPHLAFLISAWIVCIVYGLFACIFLAYAADRPRFMHWLLLYISSVILICFCLPSAYFFYYTAVFTVLGNFFFMKILSYRLLENKLHVIGLDTAILLNFFFLSHTINGFTQKFHPIVIAGLGGLCWSLPLVPGVKLAKRRAKREAERLKQEI